MRNFARDVARLGRCKKYDCIRHVLRLAEVPQRYVVTRKLIATRVARIDAIDDLLAEDTARRERIDRDPELADLAREPFRPRINGGFR